MTSVRKKHIMHFSLKLMGIVLCTSFMACASYTPWHQTKQTLEGYIYNLSGNQMPGPGRPKSSKGKGVIREIWIYRPTSTTQAKGQMPLFTNIHTTLIARTQSDSTGHYLINLPAGKYSVFIKEANGFFASETDGTGCLNPVEVSAGQTTRRDFTITLNAAF